MRKVVGKTKVETGRGTGRLAGKGRESSGRENPAGTVDPFNCLGIRLFCISWIILFRPSAAVNDLAYK